MIYKIYLLLKQMNDLTIFEAAHRDILFLLALELDVPDLLNLCKTYVRVDELICNRKDIWIRKLKPFYSDVKDISVDVKTFTDILPNKNMKDIYSLMYSLNVIKQFLNNVKSKDKNKSLIEIYNLQKLSLENNQIREIPKELGNLINLQDLDLTKNQIQEIPKELGNLVNLYELWLADNQIQEIPKELGKLSNLQELDLDDNQIQEIPKELGNLTNLKYLHLSNNPIKEIPKELTDIKGIVIYLYR